MRLWTFLMRSEQTQVLKGRIATWDVSFWILEFSRNIYFFVMSTMTFLFDKVSSETSRKPFRRKSVKIQNCRLPCHRVLRTPMLSWMDRWTNSNLIQQKNDSKFHTSSISDYESSHAVDRFNRAERDFQKINVKTKSLYDAVIQQCSVDCK